MSDLTRRAKPTAAAAASASGANGTGEDGNGRGHSAPSVSFPLWLTRKFFGVNTLESTLKVPLFWAVNLITFFNILNGAMALVAAATGDIESACWLLVLSWTIDCTDGPLARTFKVGSDFGGLFDTIGDFTSFILTPFVIYVRLIAGPDTDLVKDIYFNPSWDRILPLLPGLLYFFTGSVRCCRCIKIEPKYLGTNERRFAGLISNHASQVLGMTIVYSIQNNLGWHTDPQILGALAVVLSVLMISTVSFCDVMKGSNGYVVVAWIVTLSLTYLSFLRIHPEVILALHAFHALVGCWLY